MSLSLSNVAARSTTTTTTVTNTTPKQKQTEVMSLIEAEEQQFKEAIKRSIRDVFSSPSTGERSNKKQRQNTEIIDLSDTYDDNDTTCGRKKCIRQHCCTKHEFAQDDKKKSQSKQKSKVLDEKMNRESSIQDFFHEMVHPPNNQFDCSICLEKDIQGWKGYSLLHSCQHKFCLPCLTSHIKLSPTSKIKCPDCSEILALQDIQFILTAVGEPSALESYSSKASKEMLEEEIVHGKSLETLDGVYGIETTRRCPGQHCNYTFIYKPRNPEFQEGTPFTCPQCDSSFCLQCGANDGQVGPAHTGNCYDRREQLQKEAEERRKFAAWKKENSQADARFQKLVENEGRQGITKPCPSCNFLITKDGGCEHMHCTHCNNGFTWYEEA